MPIYEFRCRKCGNVFEQIVFTTDYQDVKCPKCGDGPPDRMLSTFSAKSSGGLGKSFSSCSSTTGFS